MILSNLSIQKALDQHWLVIDPPPDPRHPSGATQCPYNTTSVDLQLWREIVRLDANLPIVIDLRRNGFAALAKASSTPFLLTAEQPFRLEPGSFVLGRTLETVKLPIPQDGAPCLAARIEGRSSFARCGLLVHFTAPTVHAGFEGPLVLEMCNLGPYAIELYERMRICQIIIEQVDGIPFRNDSQFHQQSSPRG